MRCSARAVVSRKRGELGRRNSRYRRLGRVRHRWQRNHLRNLWHLRHLWNLDRREQARGGRTRRRHLLVRGRRSRSRIAGRAARRRSAGGRHAGPLRLRRRLELLAGPTRRGLRGCRFAISLGRPAGSATRAGGEPGARPGVGSRAGWLVARIDRLDAVAVAIQRERGAGQPDPAEGEDEPHRRHCCSEQKPRSSKLRQRSRRLFAALPHGLLAGSAMADAGASPLREGAPCRECTGLDRFCSPKFDLVLSPVMALVRAIRRSPLTRGVQWWPARTLL